VVTAYRFGEILKDTKGLIWDEGRDERRLLFANGSQGRCRATDSRPEVGEDLGDLGAPSP